MASNFSCLFCLGRLRKGVATYSDCQSSLWRLEHLASGSRDQTYTPLYPILWKLNFVQPAWKDSTQSYYPQINGKNNSTSLSVWSEEACVAMKRKMGQLWTSPTKSSRESSPTVSPNKRGKKQARISGQTVPATASAVDGESELVTQDSDGRKKNCLQKEDAHDAKKTKPVSVTTNETLSSCVHQVFMQIAQKTPSALTAQSIATTTQHPLSDSAVLSVATKSSLGQLEWLGYLPAYLPQTQSQSVVPASVSQGSIAKLSLMPCRSYRSSSIKATSTWLRKSDLSLKDETERNTQEEEEKEEEEEEEENLTNKSEKASVEIVTWSRHSGAIQKDALLVRPKEKASSAVETVSWGRSRFQKLSRSHKKSEKETGASTSIALQSDSETDTCTDSVLIEDYDVRSYHQKLKQLPRQWEWTHYGTIRHSRVASHSSRRRGPVEFSVMTYNILAQNLLENHPYLYTGCHSQWLKWQHRRKILMAEIAYHNPDIVNLQEVNKDHYFDYLKPRLERLGYTGNYQKRRGDKLDGCATLWKKDKFNLLRFTPVDYYRGGLLDRDNIAIIVELQPIRSGKRRSHSGASSQRQSEDKLVVANTHLLFNPRRGDIKLAQLILLLAELDKHAYLGGPRFDSAALHEEHHEATRGRLRNTHRSSHQSPTNSEAPPTKPSAGTIQAHYCPIILTGDFNLEPQSDLYKFLVSGQLDYEGLLVREMSGQEEGYYGRSSQLLERNFLSQAYGVTSSCQYYTVVADRHPDICGHDNFPSNDPEDYTSSSSTVRRSHSLNVGRLWHHLNLVSAYRHRIERLGRVPEVTTHHNRGQCMVDYIFYSVDSKENGLHQGEMRRGYIRNGRLKLLARYGLMSAREMYAVGCIPNDLLPSDHVCLITKFLLT